MSSAVLAPPSISLSAELQQALDKAREAARLDGVPYAGGLTPRTAWALVEAGAAQLVDVRSAEEYRFVGHVPGTLNVPWATGTSLTRNPRFVRELEAKLRNKEQPVLLLCRSGKRSALAAEAASKTGLPLVFNVLEGFEGEIDPYGQRGHGDGWRFHGLPWEQD